MLSGSGLYLDKHGGQGVHDRHFSTNPTPPFEEPAFNLPPSHVNIVKTCKLLSTSQRLEIYKIWPAAIPLSLRPTPKRWEKGGKRRNHVCTNGNRSADIFCSCATKMETFLFRGRKKERKEIKRQSTIFCLEGSSIF